MYHANGSSTAGSQPLAGESRGARLHLALTALLEQAPELEAAALVSFDGLPMASALPAGMDEDRVAAMSAALLSLGEKAAAGLGRGDLAQVYVEGEHGTVFLVSAADEAVLVAVAAPEAKTGLMLWEIRHAAAGIGSLLTHGVVASDVPAAEGVAAPALEAPMAPSEPFTDVYPSPYPVAAPYAPPADTFAVGPLDAAAALAAPAGPPAAPSYPPPDAGGDAGTWTTTTWSPPEWPARADGPWAS